MKEIFALKSQKNTIKFSKFLDQRIKYYIDQFFLNLNLVNKYEEEIFIRNINLLITKLDLKENIILLIILKIREKII